MSCHQPSRTFNSAPSRTCATTSCCKRTSTFNFTKKCCETTNRAVPASENKWTPFTMNVRLSSQTSPVIKANDALENAVYKADGDTLFIQYYYRHDDNTGASNGTAPGSGTYLFDLPESFRSPWASQVVGTAHVNGRIGYVVGVVNTLVIELQDAVGSSSVYTLGSAFPKWEDSTLIISFNATIQLN